MTAAADVSSAKRLVSRKLPTGQSALKDAFFPQRQPRRDSVIDSSRFAPMGSAPDGPVSARKTSAIPMERCLRVPRSSSKGPHYFSQKEEEIRDGVLHLKPKFHVKNDVLFVEFPTPELAKKALDSLGRFKVTGISATYEMQNHCGKRDSNTHTMDAKTLDLLDKNAELMRSYYDNKHGGGGGGGSGGGGSSVRNRKCSDGSASYMSKMADRSMPTGTAAARNSADMFIDPLMPVDADDPFGLDVAAGGRSGSRASSEEGIMKPRSESAMGHGPATPASKGVVSLLGGGDARYGDAGGYPGIRANPGANTYSVGAIVPTKSTPVQRQPANKPKAPPGETTKPSLLGPSPSQHPDTKPIFDLIAQSLSRVAEERNLLERNRQQFENEKLRFRKELDYEKSKVAIEWKKIALERGKFTESLESLKRMLAANKLASPAKSTDGQIVCQDVRLMENKSNVEVWTEVCKMKTEAEESPLIDLFSGKDGVNDDDDAKSILSPVRASDAKEVAARSGADALAEWFDKESVPFSGNLEVTKETGLGDELAAPFDQEAVVKGEDEEIVWSTKSDDEAFASPPFAMVKDVEMSDDSDLNDLDRLEKDENNNLDSRSDGKPGDGDEDESRG